MISINDFKFEKIIGKGSYGTVYSAIKKNNKQIYAIKKIKITNINHYDKKYIINEIKILASHTSINLIDYYTVFLNIDHIYIVTEYAPNGDIWQLIKKHKLNNTRFSDQEIWQNFIQICLGIQYLHKNNIIHRDIKSSNLFIDKNNNIKIGDFGIIKILQPYMMYAQTQIGTPYYMAPEIYKHQRYTEKSDIWSLGCVLYEMMFLTQPFTGCNIVDLKYKILRGKYNINLINYNIELKLILQAILIPNSYHRPSINDILNKPSIKSRINSLNKQEHFNIKPLFNEPIIIPHKPDDWKLIVNKYCIQNEILPIIPPKISNHKVYKSNNDKFLPIVKKNLIPTQILPQEEKTPTRPTKPTIPIRPIRPIRPTRPTKANEIKEVKENNKIFNPHVPIISNEANEELIALNKEIKILIEDIEENKKKLDIKFCKLEYFNKRKREIINQNNIIYHNKLPPIKNPNHITHVAQDPNNIYKSKNFYEQCPKKFSPKTRLLIKIGSRHEPNHFLNQPVP